MRKPVGPDQVIQAAPSSATVGGYVVKPVVTVCDAPGIDPVLDPSNTTRLPPDSPVLASMGAQDDNDNDIRSCYGEGGHSPKRMDRC